MKVKKKHFIVLYCEDWSSPLKTSKHHFLNRLVKEGHKILYVEVPLNPISYFFKPRHYFSKENLNAFKGIRRINKNLYCLKFFVPLPYHPMLGFMFDNNLINYFNQKFATFILKKYSKRLNLVELEAIVYYPMIYPVINDLKIKKIYFHIVDEWQGFSGIPKSMLNLTKKILKVSNTVIVSSQRLYNRYKQFSNNIHLLEHGTDFEMFNEVYCNKKKNYTNNTITSKLNVGYYGSLEKLDFEIIEIVSKQFKQWNFYFVGPFKNKNKYINRFENGNVHFLKQVERSKLPFFLEKIDLFWMPFKVNELTRSMLPIKIYEVMSSGLPIVSRDLEGCRSINEDLIFFFRDDKDVIEKLLLAKQSDNNIIRRRRINFVKPLTWDKRFTTFKKLINLT